MSRATKSFFFICVIAFALTFSAAPSFAFHSQSIISSSDGRGHRPLATASLTETIGYYSFTTRHALYLASSSSDNEDTDSKPKIRFSGIDLDRSSNTRKSPVDILFAGLTSDVTSIALGTIGLLILLIGRLILDADSSSTTDDIMASTDYVEALGQATRVNLLAVFACGAILLNGVSKLDIQSAMAERVQLIGVRPAEPVLLKPTNASDHDNDDEMKTTTERMTWVLQSMLTASPASSVVLLQTENGAPWQIQGYAGIVPEALANSGGQDTGVSLSLPADETPILDRLRREETESYLPTLQALPGRFEFSFLPSNTQAVLLLPVVCGYNRRAALVLGANQARTFTPRDIAWCQVVANRLAECI